MWKDDVVVLAWGGRPWSVCEVRWRLNCLSINRAVISPLLFINHSHVLGTWASSLHDVWQPMRMSRWRWQGRAASERSLRCSLCGQICNDHIPNLHQHFIWKLAHFLPFPCHWRGCQIQNCHFFQVIVANVLINSVPWLVASVFLCRTVNGNVESCYQWVSQVYDTQQWKWTTKVFFSFSLEV